MPFLSKDQVEIQKIAIELPRAALSIVTFLATATAFVLRLSLPLDEPTQQRLALKADQIPYVSWIVLNIETLFKVAFVFAMISTLYFFYSSYNFIAKTVANVTTPIDEPQDGISDEKMEALLDDLLDKDYTNLKRWTNFVIFLWAIVLTSMAVFL